MQRLVRVAVGKDAQPSSSETLRGTNLTRQRYDALWVILKDRRTSQLVMVGCLRLNCTLTLYLIPRVLLSNEADASGRTALAIVPADRFRDLKDAAAALFKSSTCPNVQDHDGNTPPHYAALRLEDELLAKRVLVAGVSPLAYNNHGNTLIDFLQFWMERYSPASAFVPSSKHLI